MINELGNREGVSSNMQLIQIQDEEDGDKVLINPTQISEVLSTDHGATVIVMASGASYEVTVSTTVISRALLDDQGIGLIRALNSS